jgi:C4-dicarboxylate-specific signal transduction histidine kinase
MPKRNDKSKVILSKISNTGLPYPPNPHESPLTHLSALIIESIYPGVVAFDNNLKVIHTNTRALELIEADEYIDQSLSKGTDQKVWNNWTDLLKSSIASGQKAEFKAVRYKHKGIKRLLHISCTALQDTQTQTLLGGAIVIEDVTKRIDTEQQLAQAERLAALGKVAGKVAHELNNPMDGILRYVNLALRVMEKNDVEKAKEYIQHSRSGLMRMVHIISELLEFSRNTYTAFEYAPIDKIIKDAVRAMEPEAKHIEIQIVQDCQMQLPHIKNNNLFQVFCNLIKNAVDAVEGKGTLTITTKVIHENVAIEFRDTGPGFRPENAEAIFEPFFTTKERGRGTGLGLAICKDIVEKYNGRITAENAAGGGSIFTVYLPITNEQKSQ